MSAPSTTPDPNALPVPLPEWDDPDAARAGIRTMMLDEAAALIEASGFPLGTSRFFVQVGGKGRGVAHGSLSFAERDMEKEFSPRLDPEQWPEVEAAMAAAARDLGWTQAGTYPGLNLRKGPLFFRGGCHVSPGCGYEMETSGTKQRVTDWPLIEDDPPELARFLRPRPATPPVIPPLPAPRRGAGSVLPTTGGDEPTTRGSKR